MNQIIGADVVPAWPEPSRANEACPAVAYLRVDEESAGQRLDNFLLRALKGVPKTHIYRIIRSGEVRINSGRALAKTRVEPGDSVRLPPIRQSERARRNAAPGAGPGAAVPGQASRAGRDIDFALLFEDDQFLALDKPSGLAVHGGSGISFGLIERLRLLRPTARYLELVHRLDRETSGVLLVAKKRSALRSLQQQFRARETGKIYLAMVAGDWPARKKLIEAPLQRYLIDGASGEERRVRVVPAGDPDGRTAVTLVKVVSKLTECTLLQVTIKTGRTHQIRVHLANAGHPILGDAKYGDFELNKRLAGNVSGAGLRRMFLHAWRMQIDHPTTQTRMLIEAPLARDLQAWMDSHGAATKSPAARHVTAI